MTTKNGQPMTNMVAAGANGGFGGTGGLAALTGQEASVVLKISSQVSSAEAVLAQSKCPRQGMTSVSC